MGSGDPEALQATFIEAPTFVIMSRGCSSHLGLAEIISFSLLIVNLYKT